MKSISILFLSISITITASSQTRSVIGAPVSNNFQGEAYGTFYNSLMARTTKGYESEGTYEGNPYLFDNWRKGFVEYKGNMFEFEQINYHVKDNTIEILTEGKISVLDELNCDRFLISNLTGNYFEFTTGKSFKNRGAPIIGYFETYYLGDKVNLLLHPWADVIKADYNEVTMSGNKSDKILVKKGVFFEKDGDLTEIKKKKDLIEFFNKEKEVAKFLKSHNLDHRKPEDILRVLLEFENSI